VECGLKARIAKGVKKYDFYPSRRIVEDAYTHNLNKLVVLANLDQARSIAAQGDPLFARSWRVVAGWSEVSRYVSSSEQTCREFLNAIMNKDHGVMPWLKKHW